MVTLVNQATPDLMDHYGVGPDSAATLLVTAGDTPERLGSEASFAKLCGTAPLDASTGTVTRRRLNRGGDRQANAAFYRIALARMRHDTAIRDYVTRRTNEAESTLEIIRCLKRYNAREPYPDPTTANNTRLRALEELQSAAGHPRFSRSANSTR